MVLLKYLKVKKKPHEGCLPDPEGPLSRYLSIDAIREANKEVSSLVSKEASKRMPYLEATPEQKAIIGKYAAENGIVNSSNISRRIFRMTLSKRARCVVGKILTCKSYKQESDLAMQT